ncbi:tRNA-splicing ligase [Acrasis kona]|uniref:3'-phosphate/5'-hydroxy nucleic acid ligase n=1 Tax=Acrasis kona TaxID=1008807 RepID=A0AAW2ZBX4_9EUKA
MFNIIKSAGVPIKAWTKYVPVEEMAMKQLKNLASLPIIKSHISVMPDVHFGMGATVGSIVPTTNAIIPAAVGVDIGCGMCAIRTSLVSEDLPDSLKKIRDLIEDHVPVGFNSFKSPLESNVTAWNSSLKKGYEKLCEKHPTFAGSNKIHQLGTLGGGNHFIELCIDDTPEKRVWIMLHSGSRNIGNRIGHYFIELAKKDMIKNHCLSDLPDADLAYLSEGTLHFDDYVFAVEWAQEYAATNRQLMMKQVIKALHSSKQLPKNISFDELSINCHHNYISREKHFGQDMYITRKGAVRSRKGELGIIPGSMGERSFIVRGLGNPESYESCSHGAGRLMSRNSAKRKFTIQNHIESTKGVECRKDGGVLDETPGCYKNIHDVMRSQSDLVEVLYVLKQVLCVKG